MHNTSNLQKPEKLFIVLVALIGALLLYVGDYGHDQGWWPMSELGGRIYWYTLGLAIPLTLILCVQELRDRRFWVHAVVVAIVYAVTSSWAVWSATGELVQSDEVLGPFGAGSAVALFIGIAFLQGRQQTGLWRVPYSVLHDYAWQNALTLGVAGVFVGLSWAVVWLWGALFKMVGVRFFEDMFQESWFVHLATGLFIGLGVLIARTQYPAIKVARSIIFAVFKGLVPVGSFVLLIFIISLPFIGIDALWETKNATLILSWALVFLVVGLNAVFQDGGGIKPYPAWIRAVVSAAILSAPIYAVLAAYAMYLRIEQYGWTAERWWAACVVTVLSVYAFGYALALIRGRGGWLGELPRVNVFNSALIVALVIAANSWLLDPHRLGVSSQAGRYLSSDANASCSNDIAEYLRWNAGRRGVSALQDIIDSTIPDKDKRCAKVSIAKSSRWSHNTADEIKLIPQSAQELKDALRQYGDTPVPLTFFEALQEGRVAPLSCLRRPDNCGVRSLEFDGIGGQGVLLCTDIITDTSPSCALSSISESELVFLGVINVMPREFDAYPDRKMGRAMELPISFSGRDDSGPALAVGQRIFFGDHLYGLLVPCKPSKDTQSVKFDHLDVEEKEALKKTEFRCDIY